MKNRFMRHFPYKIIFAIALIFCVSCEKSEPEGINLGSAHLYSNWGASKGEIMKYMKEYTLDKEENNYLYFSKSGASHIVSYAFQNGELHTCILMINQDKESDSAIDQFITDCTEVGSIDEKTIYINEGKNMLVTCGIESDNNITYTTLGLTQLN